MSPRMARSARCGPAALRCVRLRGAAALVRPSHGCLAGCAEIQPNAARSSTPRWAGCAATRSPDLVQREAHRLARGCSQQWVRPSWAARAPSMEGVRWCPQRWARFPGRIVVVGALRLQLAPARCGPVQHGPQSRWSWSWHMCPLSAGNRIGRANDGDGLENGELFPSSPRWIGDIAGFVTATSHRSRAERDDCAVCVASRSP